MSPLAQVIAAIAGVGAAVLIGTAVAHPVTPAQRQGRRDTVIAGLACAALFLLLVTGVLG